MLNSYLFYLRPATALDETNFEITAITNAVVKVCEMCFFFLVDEASDE